MIEKARREATKFTLVALDRRDHRKFRYGLKDFAASVSTKRAVDEALAAAPGQVVAVSASPDLQKVADHVARIADLVDVPVTEPRVKFVQDGGFIAQSSGKPGRIVNQRASSAAIATIIQSDPLQPKTVNLVFKNLYPKVHTDDLKGLGDLLVAYRTTFHPYLTQRTENLTLAAHNINGSVVGPGEVFSYNDTVGPRTLATGFKDAIIYVRDRMKKDIGGGICQVSSTLYNCVLLANLGIVERHCHSLPVYYVPPGRDATVSWGSDDFKFRNTTRRPIVIRANVSGGALTEMLIGDTSALPHPEQKVAISVTPKRTYKTGFAVSAYRVVREDGNLVAKEPLGTSFYHFPVGPEPH